jgi:hypothetical protein
MGWRTKCLKPEARIAGENAASPAYFTEFDENNEEKKSESAVNGFGGNVPEFENGRRTEETKGFSGAGG